MVTPINKAEKITIALKRGREALKDLPQVTISEMAFIGFSDKINMTPSMVVVEVNVEKIVGNAPKRLSYSSQQEYLQAYREWKVKAELTTDSKIKEAKKALRAAKVPYRAGKLYNWSILRLA